MKLPGEAVQQVEIGIPRAVVFGIPAFKSQ